MPEEPDVREESSRKTEGAQAISPLLRRNAVFLIAVLGLFALGLTLSILAARSARFPGDERLAILVRSIDLPYFDGLMRLVTDLGYLTPVLVLTAFAVGVLWLCRRRLEATFVLLSLSGQVVVVIVKVLVHRPRPPFDLLRGVPPAITASFPSGHVVHFVVFFGFLMYVAHATVEQRWVRLTIYAVGGALIVLVGISRVYLGAHWPSDVLGGYVVGCLWLLILIRAYQVARGLTHDPSPIDY